MIPRKSKSILDISGNKAGMFEPFPKEYYHPSGREDLYPNGIFLFDSTIHNDSAGDIHEWPIVWQKSWTRYKGDPIPWLFREIPVFLVDETMCGKTVDFSDYGKVPVPNNIVDNFEMCKRFNTKDCPLMQDPYSDLQCKYKNCCVVGHVDLLGAFTVIPSEKQDTGQPAIFIWMDRIKESATTPQEEEWLFAKVMLHEFAHAFMHIGVFRTDDFYKYNEESLANAYALAKIKATRKSDFYDYAKGFVLKQPAEYRGGVLFAERSVDEILDFMIQWINTKYSLFHR